MGNKRVRARSRQRAVVTGQQRREAIPPALFGAVAEQVPRLVHAICATPSVMAVSQLTDLLDEVSEETDDGRWLVADVLVTFLLGNLEHAGVRGTEKIRTFLAPYRQPSPGWLPLIQTRAYVIDMGHAQDFLFATMADDYDTAMTLVDRHGRKLLVMLAMLVSANCPVHQDLIDRWFESLQRKPQ